MFQHHTRYPLHRALEHNHPELVESYLKELKSDPKELCNRTNHRGLTALQMAAMEGHKHVIRSLLFAGADINKTSEIKDEDPEAEKNAQKSPLYLAVERGHKLLAQFLLLLGADKNAAIAKAKQFQQQHVLEELDKLQVDASLAKGVLLNELSKEIHQSLIKVILSNLESKQLRNEIPQLIQLCRKHNAHEYVTLLENTEKLSKEDSEFLQLIYFYHFDAVEFDRRSTTLSPQQFDRLEKYMYFEHKPLSHHQRYIYESAQGKDNQARLKMLCAEEKDVAEVLSYACNMSDYTVIGELRKLFSNKQLLDISLDYKLTDFTKLLIFAFNEHDVYQLALNYQGHKPRFDSLVSIVGAQTILHQLVNRCMGHSEDTPFSSQEKSLFFLFRQEHELFANVFMRCLADKYPDKRLTPLLAMHNQSLTKRLDGLNLYSYNYLIETNLQRLKYPLPNLTHTPPLAHVVNRQLKLTDLESYLAKLQILPFFTLNEVKTLSRTCKTMNKWPAKFSVSAKGKLSADKEILERQYRRVERFLNNVKQEIKATPDKYWKEYNDCIIGELIAFLISSPLFVTAAAYIKSTFDNISQLKSGLFDIQIPTNSSLAQYGRNCGEAFLYTWYCERPSDPNHLEAYPWDGMPGEPCENPCTQLYHQNGLAVAEIFSILLLGPTALGTFITLITLLCDYLNERAQILKHDLSKFSAHLKTEHSQLCGLGLLDRNLMTADHKQQFDDYQKNHIYDYYNQYNYRSYYYNPYAELRISDVLLQAKTAMIRIKEQISEINHQLKGAKGLNYVIDIKEEKESKRHSM